MKEREGITCSIGIGPNKLIAKIASAINKPNGITLVKPEKVKEFLAPLSVNKRIGVGKVTEKVLTEMGIKTIGDLSKYDAQILVERFSKRQGTYLHNTSNGICNEPVKEREREKSISKIKMLKEDTKDIEIIIHKTEKLCEENYKELRERELLFKSVGVITISKDLKTHSRQKTLDKST